MSENALTIYELLRAQAARASEAVAILAPERAPLTYQRLYQHIQDVIGQLSGLGLGRNDRVAIAMPNGPEMAVAFLSVAAAATCAPLNPAYRQSEFDFYLSDLRAKALIVLAGIESPARDVANYHRIPTIDLELQATGAAGLFTLSGKPQPLAASGGVIQPEDVALVLHTSGTTSRPKMVPLTQQNLCSSVANICRTLELSSADRCLNIMPLFHIHGLVGAVLASIASGSSIVCSPGFDASSFFDWLTAYRPSWYTAVPTMHQAILKEALAHSEVVSKHRLRFIRSSSAALPPQVMAELERTFGVPVIESYGMTEASHQMCSSPLPPGERKPGSVGLPAGPEVAIMDETGRLLPPNELGEIVIRGPSVMTGYANNPAADEVSFSNGWFRTGDQGRIDEDGYVFITGRLKEMINRGGEKISPREVDEVLLDHPAVRQAVTFAVPHAQLGEDIAAAVVLGDVSATEQEIRQFALNRLADFKVPSRVVFVDQIPKGPTGKLQRIGLHEKLADQLKVEFEAPRNAVEATLAQIWCHVLELNQVGAYENFFELGGDSLSAARVMSAVRKEFLVELPLRALFEVPTLATMGKMIQSESRIKQRPKAPPIKPISRQRPIPQSFAQQRLWLLDQMQLGGPAYTSAAAYRFVGPLNRNALERVLNEIIRRHEGLRTTFTVVEGEPVQVIAPTMTLSLRLVDLGELPKTQAEAEMRRLVIKASRHVFDLVRGPLFRAKLLRLAYEEHVLVLTMHHIIFDGWSMGVLVRELTILYEAFCSAQDSPLDELPIQYADFAVWQRKWLRGPVIGRQLAYWKQQLAELPASELPTDRCRPTIPTFHGAAQSLVLSQTLSQSLLTLSKKEGVTLFMTLLATFLILLWRYTGRKDIVVGTPVANRNHAEIEGLIGFFVNTLVLRTDLSGNPTFLELLSRVREVTLEAYAHQDLPFEKLVEELQPKRSLIHTPLFQVWFAFQNTPPSTPKLPGIDLTPLEFDSGMVRHDLGLFIRKTEQGLAMTWRYKTALFNATTITRLSRHFETLIRNILARPHGQLTALEMLNESATNQRAVARRDRSESILKKFRNIKPAAITVSQEDLIKVGPLESSMTLPLVFQPRVEGIDLAGWVKTNRDLLKTRLQKHGAILFRGFNITTAVQLENFIKAISGELLEYSYRSTPRTQVSGRIYTSTEYPADQAIPLHNEMAYSRTWPMKIWFFCRKAAAQGGETPIADSRKVFARIDPRIRTRMMNKKVLYVRNYGNGLDLSWQNVFQTTDKSEVEEYCRHSNIDFDWIDGCRLRTRQLCQAVATHPETGEVVWFNQAHLFHVSSLTAQVRQSLLSTFKEEDLPRNAFYGDGSQIEDSVLAEIRAVYEEQAVTFAWLPQDILMLDNMLVAHGRKPFVGSREVVVGMAEPFSNQ